MALEHLVKDSRLTAVAVKTSRSFGQRGFVTVEHGEIVAATSQLEDEVASDVAIAAEHEDPHDDED
jgi:hypothetical protein